MRLRACKREVICLCASVVLLLTGCSRSALPKEENMQGNKPETEAAYKLSEADEDVSTDNAKEVLFDSNQQVYVIDKAGDYLLKGEYVGQLQIDVEDEIVHLILDNVDLRAQDGPGIYVKSASKVILTIPENSTCSFMDSAYYKNYPDAKACIYSESDLTINGGGSLMVYSYYKDAIRTKDTLKILGIELSLQAKGTGLRGNDGVVLQTRSLDIQCEGTGVYTEKSDKKNKGFVDISGGSVSIIAGEYGINASENVYIRDCKADVFGVVQNITCLGEQYIEEGCLQ